jgi:hypothetical protein
MTDQYQQEHVNTLENEPFYDKPLDASAATTETIQDVSAPEEKTEPWEQKFPEVVTPEEKTEPWKQTFALSSTPTPTPAPIPAAPVVENTGFPEMIIGAEETLQFRTRWNEVQAKFVDEPGSSVREADGLVAELMAKISEKFASERTTLEGKWNQGDVSTENLRQILQNYRAFLNRLLK